jgi:hypothetical protein
MVAGPMTDALPRCLPLDGLKDARPGVARAFFAASSRRRCADEEGARPSSPLVRQALVGIGVNPPGALSDFLGLQTFASGLLGLLLRDSFALFGAPSANRRFLPKLLGFDPLVRDSPLAGAAPGHSQDKQ